jgi:hypothetical protein
MDSNVRTAYIIQIHKNPNQVNLFIKQLISGQHADVFIHIDKKNEHLKKHIIESPYVHILSNNIECEWGDISQVDTTLLLLKEVISSQKQYDFVCLRSGQDLLVKKGFEEFLFKNRNKIFMSFKLVSEKDLGQMKIKWPKITRRRYTSKHPIRIYRSVLLFLFRKGLNLFPNPSQMPKEITFYKGSQWFTIPFEVAKYMIEYLDHNEWYYKFFEYTLVPDECFFHTLIMNSPYKANVVNNHLYFMKWGQTLSARNSPQDLTTKDIKMIEESGQFFARKFDETIDYEVVDFFANSIKLGDSECLSQHV